MTSLRAMISVILNSPEEVRRIAMALRPLTLDDHWLITTIEWFLIHGLADCIVTSSFALA